MTFEEYVDQLDAEAYGCGLSAEIDEVGNLKIVPIIREYEPYLPEFEVTVDLDSDGETEYVYYGLKVTLPELDSNMMDYADSMEYWLEKFVQIGRFCKYLVQNPYIASSYEEYEEEDYYE